MMAAIALSRAQHIFLGIPWVALGAEKANGGVAAGQRCPPFDELVKGTDGKANADNKKRLPACLLQHLEADENFARDDGGDKALHDMTEPIVVVAMPAENWSKPIE